MLNEREFTMSAVADQHSAGPAGSSEDFAADGLPAGYAEKLLRDWPGERLFEANLAKLDRELAEEIRSANIPPTAELTVGRDGAVTYRIADAQRAQWLGHSSMPLISARAAYQNIDMSADSVNFAMGRIGHGAEAELIVKSMAPYQALIVIEPSAVAFNLVMRIRDFTEALGSGRLVFLLGDDIAELLEKFFATHNGYNLVSQTISRPWLSEQENLAFAGLVNAAVERCADNVLKNTKRLIEQQKNWDTSRPIGCIAEAISSGDIAKLSVMNYINTYNPHVNDTTRDAMAALAALGAKTDTLILDRPGVVSHQWQLARLNRTRPDVILLVDAVRGSFPITLPTSAICASLIRDMTTLTPQENAQRFEKPLGEHDFVFCDKHEHLEKLKEKGFGADRLCYLPIAANTEIFQPLETDLQECKDCQCDIAFIADRPSSDPETYQIKLPTHQKLWNEVAMLIARSPERYCNESAEKILDKAQSCGIKLTEESTRRFFVDLIRDFLAEAVICDSYCKPIEKADLDLRVWSQLPGAFWQQSTISIDRFYGPIGPAAR